MHLSPIEVGVFLPIVDKNRKRVISKPPGKRFKRVCQEVFFVKRIHTLKYSGLLLIRKEIIENK